MPTPRLPESYSIAANMKRLKLLKILEEGPLYLIEISAKMGVGESYTQFILNTLVKAGKVKRDGTAHQNGDAHLHPRMVRYALDNRQRSDLPEKYQREWRELKRDPFEAMKLAELTRK